MGAGCGSACLPFGVSAGADVSGSLCYFANVSKIGQDTAGCSAFLSPLSLCAWCASPEYGSIARFKGGFRGFYGVCVGLCCLGALRGLCGFCARVELGGLKACGVFASVFLLLSSAFLVFALFLCSSPIFRGFVFVVLCLSSCIVFVGLWVCCCSLFPFGLYAQKERAQSVSLASSLHVLCVPAMCCMYYLFRCPPFTPFPFQVSASTPDHKVCSYSAYLR